MSGKSLDSWCGRCNSTHPVNGPCPVPPPGGGTEAAPVVCDMASLEQHHRDTVLTEAGRALVRDAGEPVCSECGRWIAERERVGAERERDEARAECERLRGLIERDRTGLAAGLDAVRKRLASSFWLANEGEWGSYEYHERTERAWRGEVRQLLEDADSLALAALRASGDRVTEAFHGPAAPGERESLRASLDAANAEVARLRGERERKED